MTTKASVFHDGEYVQIEEILGYHHTSTGMLVEAYVRHSDGRWSIPLLPAEKCRVTQG